MLMLLVTNTDLLMVVHDCPIAKLSYLVPTEILFVTRGIPL